jgi:plastocyanin
MTMRKTVIGTGLAASLLAALALATWTTASAAPSKLKGTVGPGFSISLKTAAGKKVTTVSRGTYTITVNDRSDEHNFLIRGPGVRKQITGVDFTGTKTATLRLPAGKYTFVCVPHDDDMRGSFTAR